jgi:hypothetical protein
MVYIKYDRKHVHGCHRKSYTKSNRKDNLPSTEIQQEEFKLYRIVALRKQQVNQYGSDTSQVNNNNPSQVQKKINKYAQASHTQNRMMVNKAVSRKSF